MSTLKIGLIGTGFMGQAHAGAYQRVAMLYSDLVCPPELYAVADATQALADAAAKKYGASYAYGDWREMLRDPEIDVIDITTPNTLHYEMALAAIEAGKHVYCECHL
jgi:predicted dehydrogenase